MGCKDGCNCELDGGECESKDVDASPPISDDDRTARLLPLFNYWIKQLGLKGAWDITFYFVPDIDEQKIFAQVNKQPPYRKATIKFSRWAIDNALARELERVVIHELMHIVVDPLNAVARTYFDESGEVGNSLSDAIETVADHVTEVLYYTCYPSADSSYHDTFLTELRKGGGDTEKPPAATSGEN